MHIVPDANVIIAEGYGDSYDFRVLIDALNNISLGYTLCVPESVLDEVAAKFERDFDDDTREIRRRIRNLSWRLDRVLSSPIEGLDKENEVALFRSRMEARFSASNRQILEYPDISHEELVRRAAARIRPFNESGSGYRDALIWETVLNLAESVDSQVALITSDNDFRNRSGELHSDLVNELASRGLPRDKVILFNSVRNFVNTYINPDAQGGI